jgi:hypothetical protein
MVHITKEHVKKASLWSSLTLGALVLLVLAYALLPLGWGHYEHRRGLQGRPMVTHTKLGIPGDPINFGLVGEEAEVLCAFRAAGWDAATPVTIASSVKIVGSVALRRAYPAAPVSALYYEGRPEDLAFEQAAGASAQTRHHVRFWRTSTPTQSGDARPLWLASASFDKGVGVSHYTFRVTHHIDADLDAERKYVSDALAKTGLVKLVYDVTGIGPTLTGRNGGGDPYFTDGEVAIETLGPSCQATPQQAPPRLANPWPARLRNRIWRHLRPLLSAMVHAWPTSQGA